MPSGMSWSEAQAVARGGLHVRRAAWAAGEWLIYQQGNAWFWTGSAWRVVSASDFERPEFQGTDWTTIPPELAACPVIPPGTGTEGEAPDPGDGTGPSGVGWSGSPGSIPAGITLPTPGTAIIIPLPGGGSRSIGPAEPSACVPPAFEFTASCFVYAGYMRRITYGWGFSAGASSTSWSVTVTAGGEGIGGGIILKSGGYLGGGKSWDNAYDPPINPPPGYPGLEGTFVAVAQFSGMDGPCAGYVRRLVSSTPVSTDILS